MTTLPGLKNKIINENDPELIKRYDYLVDDFKTYIDSFKEQNKDYLCVKLFYELI